jgi:XTP/dITP diphosphohydrolase
VTNRLLLASHNSHKLIEFRDILAPRRFEVLAPSDLQMALDVPETGETFAENARLKARAYRDLVAMPTLADDSGLVIDSLGGDPGVHSARFGGPGLTDRDRLELVLDLMRSVPRRARTARFVCALAVAWPDGREDLVEAQADGEIALAPRGVGGFGYDPIFFYPPVHKTFAELSAEEKACVSHRGRALAALLTLLASA